MKLSAVALCGLLIIRSQFSANANLVVWVNDTEVTEGDVGTTNAQFTVSLSAPHTEPVTAFFMTYEIPPSLNYPSTARARFDFISTNGSVTFSPGQTNKIVSVPVIGDAINEANEPFALGLTGATYGSTGVSGKCTINDLDVLQLRFNDPVVVEGLNGSTYAEFTLSTSRATEQSIQGRGTTFSLQAGTANSTDYSSTGGWWSLDPGPARTNLFFLSVEIFGDAANEEDETFFLALTWDAARNISHLPGKCTIINDDFTLRSSNTPSNQIRLTLEGASGAAHVLQWSTNLTGWFSFSTNAPGTNRTVQLNVSKTGHRFYRALRKMD